MNGRILHSLLFGHSYRKRYPEPSFPTHSIVTLCTTFLLSFESALLQRISKARKLELTNDIRSSRKLHAPITLKHGFSSGKRHTQNAKNLSYLLWRTNSPY